MREQLFVLPHCFARLGFALASALFARFLCGRAAARVSALRRRLFSFVGKVCILCFCGLRLRSLCFALRRAFFLFRAVAEPPERFAQGKIGAVRISGKPVRSNDGEGLCYFEVLYLLGLLADVSQDAAISVQDLAIDKVGSMGS